MSFDVRHGAAPPPEWEALAGRGPLLASPRWLRAVAGRAQGANRWFIVSDAGAPTAGLFATLAETAATDDAFNLFDIATGTPRTMPLTDEAIESRAALRSSAPLADAWFPNVVVTLPSAECIPVGVGASTPPTMAALVEGIVGWARALEMAAVAFLYVRHAHEALVDALVARSFVPIPLSSTAELHLPGNSFDDYLAGLSKGHRRTVRHDLRMVEEAGVSIRKRQMEECLDQLVELRVGLKRKYGRTPNPEKERQSFTGLTDQFAADELSLLTAEAGGRLIGFGLDVIHDGTWYGVVSGTDYDDPRSQCVSFSLDYYWPIRRAYEVGIRELQLGMAAWDAKRIRGCRLVPLDGYILPLRPELTPALTASVAATAVRWRAQE